MLSQLHPDVITEGLDHHFGFLQDAVSLRRVASGPRLEVRGLRIGSRGFGSRRQVCTQAAHVAADVVSEIVGQAPHGGGDVVLDVGQFLPSAVEFGQSGRGDGVVGPAPVAAGGYESFFLEFAKARIDGSGTGRVGPAEAFAEGLDELVAVLGPDSRSASR